MTTPTAAAGAGFFDRPIAWTEELSVGVPEIDNDHQVLIELIGQIDGSSNEPEAFTVIGTVLAALSDYTEYHFAREEYMQVAMGYPGAAAHKANHDLLKEQVQHYLSLYSTAHEGVDVQELFRFLQRWLYEHIMQEDMLYVPYCANNPKAREAVAAVGLEFFMDPETGVF